MTGSWAHGCRSRDPLQASTPTRGEHEHDEQSAARQGAASSPDHEHAAPPAERQQDKSRISTRRSDCRRHQITRCDGRGCLQERLLVKNLFLCSRARGGRQGSVDAGSKGRSKAGPAQGVGAGDREGDGGSGHRGVEQANGRNRRPPRRGDEPAGYKAVRSVRVGHAAAGRRAQARWTGPVRCRLGVLRIMRSCDDRN
jgi:hypothetical protein